jgi:hypothetical protein
MTAQAGQQGAGVSGEQDEDLTGFGVTAIDAEDVEQDVLARVPTHSTAPYSTRAHAL